MKRLNSDVPQGVKRRICRSWSAACIGLLLTLSQACYAQQRVALIIGNSEYRNEARLANPTNDARLIERTLRESPLAFSSVTRVENASRVQTLQVLARFRQQAEGADVAFVYYSGHGMIDGKRQNYLIPVEMPRLTADASLDPDTALKSYAVSEEEVISAIEGAKVQVLVMDACRDNGFAGALRSGTKGLSRRPDQTRNRLLAYATEEGRTAEDGKGSNSTYAASLAKYLVRTEWPLLKIFDEIARDVENATSNQQSPTRSGNLRTDVYLIPERAGSPPVPGLTNPEFEAWKIADSSGTLEAYQSFTNNFPTSQYSSLAQVKISAIKAAAQGSQQAEGRRRALDPRNIGKRVRFCERCPELVYLTGGTFLMGSQASESKRSLSEGPQRTVSIEPLWFGVFEVTNGEWDACASDGACSRQSLPSTPDIDRLPKVNVTWEEAQGFAGWMSKRSSRKCRLPSESEWEFAARGGTTSSFSSGERIEPTQANFDSSFTHNGSEKLIRQLGAVKVGSFPANTFGIHDMHGNAREWVQDVWHRDYNSAPNDGTPWIEYGDPKQRVVRGGGWDSYPHFLRAAARDWTQANSRSATLGFRIVCE